jgi:putative membrane protein
MIEVSQLPAVNATLNGTSAILLAGGYACIRAGNRRAHAGFMIAAVVVSLVFLTTYVYYHTHVGAVTRFAGEGPIRHVYFAILISHTVLAMVTALWLVPVTLFRALRQRFEKHRAIARWALPVWFYVSVTGVVIYFMLYHWYARA